MQQLLYSTFGASSSGKEEDVEKAKGKVQEDALGNASRASTYYNIMNTILGGGMKILTMPSAVQWSGIVLFPVLVFVALLLNSYTSDLLAIGGELSGSPDYASFIGHTLGPVWRWISHLLLFISCLGVGTSLVEAAVASFTSLLAFPYYVCAIVITGLALSLMLALPNVDSIAQFSKVASLIVLFFLLWVICDGAVDMGSHHVAVSLPWWPASFANVANSASLILFSTGFHPNVIPIFSEIQKPKREGWLWSLVVATISSFVCFILFGILPVLAHPSSYDTVVAQFSGPLIGKILALLLGVGFVMSLPLCCIAGIGAISEFLFLSGENSGASGARLLPGSAGRGKMFLAKVVFSFLILAACLLIPNINNVVTITSALVLCPTGFILPAVAFFRISYKTDLDAGMYSFRVVLCVAFLGVALWAVCLYSLHALLHNH